MLSTQQKKWRRKIHNI